MSEINNYSEFDDSVVPILQEHYDNITDKRRDALHALRRGQITTAQFAIIDAEYYQTRWTDEYINYIKRGSNWSRKNGQ